MFAWKKLRQQMAELSSENLVLKERLKSQNSMIDSLQVRLCEANDLNLQLQRDLRTRRMKIIDIKDVDDESFGMHV